MKVSWIVLLLAMASTPLVVHAAERGGVTTSVVSLHAADRGAFTTSVAAIHAGERAALTTSVVSIADYAILQEGVTLHFEDRNSGEKFRMFTRGTHEVNGVVSTVVARTREGEMAQDGDDFDLITVDAAGLRLHHRYVRGNHLPLTPPVVFSEKDVEPGRVIETVPNMLNPATFAKMSWQVQTARTLETVTVPAGSFARCLKLKLVVKDLSLGTVLTNLDMWFAPGVGLVKRQGHFFGYFQVEQLTSIERKI